MESFDFSLASNALFVCEILLIAAFLATFCLNCIYLRSGVFGSRVFALGMYSQYMRTAQCALSVMLSALCSRHTKSGMCSQKKTTKQIYETTHGAKPNKQKLLLRESTNRQIETSASENQIQLRSTYLIMSVCIFFFYIIC